MKNDPKAWDDYIFHITNFVNPNRNLTVLPALKQVWDLIDIPNINRLKSTKEVFEVAADVYIVIHEAIDKAYEEFMEEMYYILECEQWERDMEIYNEFA